MLRLNTIRREPGATHRRKRVGRGSSSGKGGHMSTRGGKGQKARKGFKIFIGFEGGQMPLYRRLPKVGFKNVMRRASSILNVAELEKLDAAQYSEISPETMKKAGLIRKNSERFVVLGTGELTKAFKIKAHRVSPQAKEKIEKAGGQVELIAVPTTNGKKKTKRNPQA